MIDLLKGNSPLETGTDVLYSRKTEVVVGGYKCE
jgi:hypothetical protein